MYVIFSNKPLPSSFQRQQRAMAVAHTVMETCILLTNNSWKGRFPKPGTVDFARWDMSLGERTITSCGVPIRNIITHIHMYTYTHRYILSTLRKCFYIAVLKPFSVITPPSSPPMLSYTSIFPSPLPNTCFLLSSSPELLKNAPPMINNHVLCMETIVTWENQICNIQCEMGRCEETVQGLLLPCLDT